MFEKRKGELVPVEWNKKQSKVRGIRGTSYQSLHLMRIAMCLQFYLVSGLYIP